LTLAQRVGFSQQNQQKGQRIYWPTVGQAQSFTYSMQPSKRLWKPNQGFILARASLQIISLILQEGLPNQ
jgi:hypothetical protein